MPANGQMTLFAPPPADASKAPIENALELAAVLDIGPDVFTNTRPLWHPPGARGIYGGAAIAQSLSAAQLTVPADFAVHSMHCYFVLAGDSQLPILYHVERVRDGRSFATRTVQARQRGRPIFTTTLSFMKVGSGGKKTLDHAVPRPDVPLPDDIDESSNQIRGGPFESKLVTIHNNQSSNPADKRVRQYIRCRGTISEGGGHDAHLSAFAYMSDNYFIGTIGRVHSVPRFSKSGPVKKDLPSPPKDLSGRDAESVRRYLENLAKREEEELRSSRPSDTASEQPPPGKISMMVSLDHAIYFHNPHAFRADEWLLTEMDSQWAGEGRGLVHQRVWSKDGVLIATCTQEGVVRLSQDEEKPASKL